MADTNLSKHSLAIVALAWRCGDPLVRVFNHDRLQNAVLGSAVFVDNVLKPEICVQNQDLKMSENSGHSLTTRILLFSPELV